MSGARAVRLVMIPGVGADARLFDRQRDAFPDLEVATWLAPQRHESLRSYAGRMADGIGRGDATVLVGVSIGGMLALEMAERLGPLGVVLIASCRSGRSVRAGAAPLERVGRVLPTAGISLLRSFKPGLAIAFGPAPAADRALFAAMLADAPIDLVRWAGRAILEWDGPANLAGPVRHIHGASDRIIPLRRVEPDTVVPGAGHLVNLTHANRVNAFIAEAIVRFTSAAAVPA